MVYHCCLTILLVYIGPGISDRVIAHASTKLHQNLGDIITQKIENKLEAELPDLISKVTQFKIEMKLFGHDSADIYAT